MSMTVFDVNAFKDAVDCAVRGLNELAEVVKQYREQWLCEGEGETVMARNKSWKKSAPKKIKATSPQKKGR